MDFYKEGPNQSFNEEFITLSLDKLHYESLNEESSRREPIHAPPTAPPINGHHNVFNTPPPEAPPDNHDGIPFGNEAYGWLPFPPCWFGFFNASTVMPAEPVYRTAPSFVPRTNPTYNALPMPDFGINPPGGNSLYAPSFSPASSTTTTLAAASISSATASPPPSHPDQGHHTSALAAYTEASAANDALADPLPPAESSATHRAEEDRSLMEYRRQGMSYAAIKKKLGSNVAESTLRGRHRQLTLAPRDRERRPTWLDKDIDLLRRAVPLYRKAKSGKAKVLWERVGQYILDHGGSRKFSGKTCHVKYREMTGRDYE